MASIINLTWLSKGIDMQGTVESAVMFDFSGKLELAGWHGEDKSSLMAGRYFKGTTGSDTLTGGDGDDGLYGGNDTDSISGGAGGDSISGGNDDDSVFGNDGNDLIFGGAGNDFLVGGSFDDMPSEQVGSGCDTVYGGAGNDRIYGLQDDDLLFGGVGNDFFGAGIGNDLIYGGAGDDRTQSSNGDDSLFGGAGNDVLTDGLGADVYFGGAGSDAFVYQLDDDVDRDQGGPTSTYGVGDDRIVDFRLAEGDRIVFNLDLGNVVVSNVIDDGESTAFVLSHGEVVTAQGFSGQDFQDGLRFDSTDDINAMSQQMYGYDAILFSEFV